MSYSVDEVLENCNPNFAPYWVVCVSYAVSFTFACILFQSNGITNLLKKCGIDFSKIWKYCCNHLCKNKKNKHKNEFPEAIELKQRGAGNYGLLGLYVRKHDNTPWLQMHGIPYYQFQRYYHCNLITYFVNELFYLSHFFLQRFFFKSQQGTFAQGFLLLRI